MDYKKAALDKHFEWRGKLEISPRVPAGTAEALSLAYTPGVAEPCLAIKNNPSLSFKLTRRWNTVAVVTDGTAVLGLGDIGPEAAMPVMEGKCVLFKAFGGVDAFPLCVGSKDTDEIVRTVSLLSGGFGGINLEDIAAPRCFEIEERLKAVCGIPVFHDDQHGTAVVVCAGLINALAVAGKWMDAVSAVILGAGAAGVATARLMLDMGFRDITLINSKGAVTPDDTCGSPWLNDIASRTNPGRQRGGIADIIKGKDVFIGLSRGGLLDGAMVSSMAKGAVVFAMANPDPEIAPDAARAAGAAVVATGRSDYPNQINNVLAFPGIFRGALDARAKDINRAMLMAASKALAALAAEDGLSADYIIPAPFDARVAPAVASAVIAAYGEETAG